MEIKYSSAITILLLALISCKLPIYTVDELKGTYREFKTKNSRWAQACTLTINDSTLTVTNCYLLKNFVGNRVHVNGDVLWYERDGFSSFFEISKEDGVIYLYKSFEDDEDIKFEKND